LRLAQIPPEGIVDRMAEQSCTGPVTGSHADTNALLNRHRRIDGEVRGQRMVEYEARCIDKLEEATHAIARLVRS
jgi:hypothetical protein